MKRIIRKLCPGPKDLIALIIVGFYSLSFFITVIVPGVKFDELMGRQYERIMLMVVGFYFGSHGNSPPNNDDDETK